MSYVNKRTRIFQASTDLKLAHIRSEGRMKSYPSATDVRAWSDVVEERRQHILDYQAKARVGLCPDKIIPVEYVVESILALKNERIKILEKRIDYLENMLDIYSQLSLTSEQQKKLETLKKELKDANAELAMLHDDVCDCTACFQISSIKRKELEAAYSHWSKVATEQVAKSSSRADKTPRTCSCLACYETTSEKGRRLSQAWKKKSQGKSKKVKDTSDGTLKGKDSSVKKGKGTSKRKDGSVGDINGKSKGKYGTVRNKKGTSKAKDSTVGDVNDTSKEKDGTFGDIKGKSKGKDGTVGDIKGTSQEKDGTVGNVESTSEGKDGTVEDLKGTSQEKDGTVGNVESTSEGKDGTVEDLKGTSQEKDGTVGNVESTSEGKDGTVEDLKGTSQEKDGTVGNVESTSEGKDGTVEDLKGTSQEKDGTVESTSEGKDGTVEDLKGTSQEKDGTVKDIKSTSHEKDGTVGNVESTSEGKDGTVGDIKDSSKGKDGSVGDIKSTSQGKYGSFGAINGVSQEKGSIVGNEKEKDDSGSEEGAAVASVTEKRTDTIRDIKSTEKTAKKPDEEKDLGVSSKIEKLGSEKGADPIPEEKKILEERPSAGKAKISEAKMEAGHSQKEVSDKLSSNPLIKEEKTEETRTELEKTSPDHKLAAAQIQKESKKSLGEKDLTPAEEEILKAKSKEQTEIDDLKYRVFGEQKLTPEEEKALKAEFQKEQARKEALKKRLFGNKELTSEEEKALQDQMYEKGRKDALKKQLFGDKKLTPEEEKLLENKLKEEHASLLKKRICKAACSRTPETTEIGTQFSSKGKIVEKVSVGEKELTPKGGKGLTLKGSKSALEKACEAPCSPIEKPQKITKKLSLPETERLLKNVKTSKDNIEVGKNGRQSVMSKKQVTERNFKATPKQCSLPCLEKKRGIVDVRSKKNINDNLPVADEDLTSTSAKILEDKIKTEKEHKIQNLFSGDSLKVPSLPTRTAQTFKRPPCSAGKVPFVDNQLVPRSAKLVEDDLQKELELIKNQKQSDKFTSTAVSIGVPTDDNEEEVENEIIAPSTKPCKAPCGKQKSFAQQTKLDSVVEKKSFGQQKLDDTKLVLSAYTTSHQLEYLSKEIDTQQLTEEIFSDASDKEHFPASTEVKQEELHDQYDETAEGKRSSEQQTEPIQRKPGETRSSVQQTEPEEQLVEASEQPPAETLFSDVSLRGKMPILEGTKSISFANSVSYAKDQGSLPSAAPMKVKISSLEDEKLISSDAAPSAESVKQEILTAKDTSVVASGKDKGILPSGSSVKDKNSSLKYQTPISSGVEKYAVPSAEGVKAKISTAKDTNPVVSNKDMGVKKKISSLEDETPISSEVQKYVPAAASVKRQISTAKDTDSVVSGKGVLPSDASVKEKITVDRDKDVLLSDTSVEEKISTAFSDKDKSILPSDVSKAKIPSDKDNDEYLESIRIKQASGKQLTSKEKIMLILSEREQDAEKKNKKRGSISNINRGGTCTCDECVKQKSLKLAQKDKSRDKKPIEVSKIDKKMLEKRSSTKEPTIQHDKVDKEGSEKKKDSATDHPGTDKALFSQDSSKIQIKPSEKQERARDRPDSDGPLLSEKGDKIQTKSIEKTARFRDRLFSEEELRPAADKGQMQGYMKKEDSAKDDPPTDKKGKLQMKPSEKEERATESPGNDDTLFSEEDDKIQMKPKDKKESERDRPGEDESILPEEKSSEKKEGVIDRLFSEDVLLPKAETVKIQSSMQKESAQDSLLSEAKQFPKEEAIEPKSSIKIENNKNDTPVGGAILNDQKMSPISAPLAEEEPLTEEEFHIAQDTLPEVIVKTEPSIKKESEKDVPLAEEQLLEADEVQMKSSTQKENKKDHLAAEEELLLKDGNIQAELPTEKESSKVLAPEEIEHISEEDKLQAEPVDGRKILSYHIGADQTETQQIPPRQLCRDRTCVAPCASLPISPLTYKAPCVRSEPKLKSEEQRYSVEVQQITEKESYKERSVGEGGQLPEDEAGQTPEEETASEKDVPLAEEEVRIETKSSMRNEREKYGSLAEEEDGVKTKSSIKEENASGYKLVEGEQLPEREKNGPFAEDQILPEGEEIIPEGNTINTKSSSAKNVPLLQTLPDGKETTVDLEVVLLAEEEILPEGNTVNTKSSSAKNVPLLQTLPDGKETTVDLEVVLLEEEEIIPEGNTINTKSSSAKNVPLPQTLSDGKETTVDLEVALHEEEEILPEGNTINTKSSSAKNVPLPQTPSDGKETTVDLEVVLLAEERPLPEGNTMETKVPSIQKEREKNHIFDDKEPFTEEDTVRAELTTKKESEKYLLDDELKQLPQKKIQVEQLPSAESAIQTISEQNQSKTKSEMVNLDQVIPDKKQLGLTYSCKDSCEGPCDDQSDINKSIECVILPTISYNKYEEKEKQSSKILDNLLEEHEEYEEANEDETIVVTDENSGSKFEETTKIEKPSKIPPKISGSQAAKNAEVTVQTIDTAIKCRGTCAYNIKQIQAHKCSAFFHCGCTCASSNFDLPKNSSRQGQGVKITATPSSDNEKEEAEVKALKCSANRAAARPEPCTGSCKSARNVCAGVCARYNNNIRRNEKRPASNLKVIKELNDASSTTHESTASQQVSTGPVVNKELIQYNTNVTYTNLDRYYLPFDYKPFMPWGVDIGDKNVVQKIKKKALMAAKSGFLVIFPDKEPTTGAMIPRGYFAGDQEERRQPPLVVTYQVKYAVSDVSSEGLLEKPTVNLVPSTRLSRVLSGDSSSLSPVNFCTRTSSKSIINILSSEILHPRRSNILTPRSEGSSCDEFNLYNNDTVASPFGSINLRSFSERGTSDDEQDMRLKIESIEENSNSSGKDGSSTDEENDVTVIMKEETVKTVTVSDGYSTFDEKEIATEENVKAVVNITYSDKNIQVVEEENVFEFINTWKNGADERIIIDGKGRQDSVKVVTDTKYPQDLSPPKERNVTDVFTYTCKKIFKTSEQETQLFETEKTENSDTEEMKTLKRAEDKKSEPEIKEIKKPKTLTNMATYTCKKIFRQSRQVNITENENSGTDKDEVFEDALEQMNSARTESLNSTEEDAKQINEILIKQDKSPNKVIPKLEIPHTRLSPQKLKCTITPRSSFNNKPSSPKTNNQTSSTTYYCLPPNKRSNLMAQNFRQKQLAKQLEASSAPTTPKVLFSPKPKAINRNTDKREDKKRLSESHCNEFNKKSSSAGGHIEKPFRKGDRSETEKGRNGGKNEEGSGRRREDRKEVERRKEGGVGKKEGDEDRKGGRSKNEVDRIILKGIPLEDSKEDLPALLIHKDTEIIALRNALVAKESYCSEQRKIAAAAIEQLDSIKNVVEERDDLRKKLERSQDELEQLKKTIAFGRPHSIQTTPRDDAQTDPCALPLVEQATSTDVEIEQLEKDIEQMRSENASPEMEAKVIRKEVEVLKKYCSKLSIIQKENYQLKAQIAQYEDTFTKLGYFDHSPTQIEELKFKIDFVTDAIRERDILKHKVGKLEAQLSSYAYLPEDVEVFKERSSLLDEILADRDRLSKRVEQLRGLDQEVNTLRKKASRVTELEDNLMKLNREKSVIEQEVDHLRCKYSAAEIEGYNRQAEGDSMRSKLVCMEHELESLKCLCEEKERLRLERDHLKNSLDEMSRMQGDFDHMKKHMKCLEVLRAERDMFKSKYENLVGLECECDILRTQVERAKAIEKERDALENQIEDLELCIAEQETEIRRLVCHIDVLAKGRDEEQEKFKELLIDMRAEVEKKDSLIVSAEEKLCLVQNELENSIEGLSSETIRVKNKNDKLETVISALRLEASDLKQRNEDLGTCVNVVQMENQKVLEHMVALKQDNENLAQHIKDLTEDNIFLIQRLEEKESSLNTLKEVLKDHEPILDEFEKTQLLRSNEAARDNQTETDPVFLMTSELEFAREENRRLHEKVTKISNLAADQQLQDLLVQSKSAVKRISNELNKQCDEWYCLQNQLDLFKPEDRAAQLVNIRKQENYIVNYCTSTGINTNIVSWDCVRARRQGQQGQQGVQVTLSEDISASGKALEVESSSFIIQDNSSPCTAPCSRPRTATGTSTEASTKAFDKAQQAHPAVCDKKIDIRASVSDEYVGGRRKHARTQRPEPVIYASRLRAKSGGTQFEYDISRWDCKRKYFVPTPLSSKGVQNVPPGASVGTEEDKSIRELRTSTCNTRRVLYSHTGTQDEVIVSTICNAACQNSGGKYNASTRTEPLGQDAGIGQSEVGTKDEETDAFDTARSTTCKHCRNLEDRIEMLEKELTSSNETILKLQDKLGKCARVTAENEALRRHSTEVQEVAKDQIEDLVDHLKKVQIRATSLEGDNEQLNKCNCTIQLEKTQLSKRIQELQRQNAELLERAAGLEKQVNDTTALDNLKRELEKATSDRADMEKILANDMVSSSKRSTLLEGELGSLGQKNKDLEEEIARLKTFENETKNLNDKLANSENLNKSMEAKLESCFEENKKLLDELNRAKSELKQLRDLQINTGELDALRKENGHLLRQVDAQALEVNQLIEKLKTPTLEISPKTEMKEKGVLKTICSDLEGQLKCLERAKAIHIPASGDVQKMLDELTKRLEDAERRAKSAEDTLSNMKISDPTAMLNGELNKCKAKLTELETENESLSKAILQGNDEIERLKRELASNQTGCKQSLDEIAQLKEALDKLKADNDKLTTALSEMSGDDLLKEEVKKLKAQIQQLENENTGLKSKLSEPDRAFDKLDKMQEEMGVWKQNLLKSENEAEKLRRELENALNSRKTDGDKIEQLEKEKTKNLTTIQNLENEIARLKKEFDSILNTAKDSSFGASELQEENARLKARINQLEGDNTKLNKDFDNAQAALKDANDQLSQKTKENEKLLQENAAAGNQLSTLKNQLDRATTDLQTTAASSKELDSLRDKLAKLQAENTALQSASKAGEKVEDLQDQIAKLRQQVATLEGDNSKLQKDFEKAKEQVKAAEAKDKTKLSSDQLAKLEAENARLNKELNAALDNLREATSTNLQAQEEVKKLKQKASLLEAENRQLKKDINDILDGSKTSTAELVKFKESESALKQRLAQLESENLQLKKDLDAVTSSNKSYMSQIQNLKQNVSQLEKERDTVKQSLEAAIKDGGVKDDSAIWRQKVSQAEDALNKLKKELEAALEEHKKCPKTISQLEDENGRLKKKLTDLENENSTLKSKYEAAMGDKQKNASELETLKVNDNKMKQLVSKLEGDNSKLNKDLIVLRAELGNIESLLSKSKEETTSLKQKTASLESANIKLKADLDAALGDSDKLQKSFKELQNENLKLKERIAQLESENAKLKKEFGASAKKDVPVFDESQLKDRIAQLENENKKIKSELNNILDEAKGSAEAKDHELKLKQQLAQLENEHSKLKKDLEKALQDAQSGSSQVFQLKDENAKLKQRVGQLENQVTGLKKDLNNALEQAKKGASGVSQAQDADAKLKQRLALLEKDNDKLKKDLEGAIKEAKSGSATTADLRDENTKQKQLASQLQAEIEKLKRKLDAALVNARKPSAESENAELRKRLNQLEKENNSLKSNLEGAFGDAKNTADANSKLIDENAKLKKKLQSLQNEMEALKRNLTACENEKKQLSGHISKMEENEANIKKRITELEAANSTLKQTLEASGGDAKAAKKMGEENAALKASLGKTEADLNKAKSSLEDAINDAKKKGNEIQKLKDEIAGLKQKIVELEKENTKLKTELDTLFTENSKLKKATGDSSSMIKENFDKDMKDLLNKNDENIAKLKKEQQNLIREINAKHDVDIKTLQDALSKAKEELEEMTRERDKLKNLLEQQRRKSLDIKGKVEQVEDVILRERRKSKEEKQKSKTLADKLEEQDRKSKDVERQIEFYKRKSEDLEKLTDEMAKKASKLEKEKDNLEKGSAVLRESFERELSKSEEMQKDIQLLRKMAVTKEDTQKKLKIETFKAVSLDGRMPEVIALTTPLSEREMKFFGKKICSCVPNLQSIATRIATDGLQSLTIEELQFLHKKIVDATGDQLTRIGQTSGVLTPNEGDKLGLLRRIAALEGDLSKKQKHAQQKVIAMQYAVKLEKERLIDLKKSLDEEKKKNTDLISQIDSHSKIVSNIRDERDSIQRQKSYHEHKLEQYIVAIEEERGKTRNLEDELEKEKTNVLHLKTLLGAERDRARVNKRKDTEALERMRIKLEKTVNSETVLKMKLQDRNKQRCHSPSIPVKDTNQPVPTKHKVSCYQHDPKPLKSTSGKRLVGGRSQVSSSRLDYSEK